MSSVSAAYVAQENQKSTALQGATSALCHLRAAQLLMDRGLLSAGDLGSAVADQIVWQSNLGEILIGKGLVRPIDYYRALASAQGLTFINLLSEPPESSLLLDDDRESYVELKIIPWRRQKGRYIIAACEIGEAQRQWADERFGPNGYSFALTSPFDIFWTRQNHFRNSDSEYAREGLFEWKPEHSAKLTVTKPQKVAMSVIGFAYLAIPGDCARSVPRGDDGGDHGSLHRHILIQVPAHVAWFQSKGRLGRVGG